MARSVDQYAAVLADGFEDLGFRAAIHSWGGQELVLVVERKRSGALEYLRVQPDGTTVVLFGPSRDWFAEQLGKLGLPPPIKAGLVGSDMPQRLGFWRGAGREDARRTAVPSVMRLDIGPTATTEDILRWLTKLPPIPIPENATSAQREQLIDAWRTGWAEEAEDILWAHIHERADQRVYRRGEDDRGPFWWVWMESEPDRGPFSTREAAREFAFNVEESGG
jgi:hypothetical protein